MKLRLPVLLATLLLSAPSVAVAQYPELPASGSSTDTTYQLTTSQTVSASETVAALYLSALQNEKLTLTIGSGATLTMTGALDFNGVGTMSVTGNIKAGSIVKNGAGTLVLDGKSLQAKTDFYVNAGFLQISGSALDTDSQTILNSNFTIESGATLSILSERSGTPKDTSGTVTMNGGTLLFGDYSETYFGGKSMTLQGVSLISGGTAQSANAGWRLEGGTGLSIPFTINVTAGGSGSRIDVKKITVTRNTRGFVIFNVEKGANTNTGDLIISSTMKAHSNSTSEGMEKKGAGSIVYTGVNTDASYLLQLRVSEGSFIVGDGGANGEWLGNIELAGGTTFGMNVSADRTISKAIKSSGTVTFKQMGSGKTTLSGDNSSLSGSIIVQNGTLVAGHAKAFGSANISLENGSVDFGGFAYAGKVDLKRGNLLQASGFSGQVSIDQTGMTGPVGNINLGGLDGSKISRLVASASLSGDNASRISGVTGGINLNAVTLGIDSGMIDVDKTATGAASITFDGGNGSLTANDITLALSGDAATELSNTIDSGVEYLYIHLSNSRVTFNSADNVKFLNPYHVFGSLVLVDHSSGGDGWLQFRNEGNSSRLIVGSGETYTVDSYNMPGFNLYKGYTVMGTMNVVLDGPPEPTQPDGLVLIDLEGPDQHAVIDSSSSGEGALITLTNDGRYMESLYQGSITGNARLVKSGSGFYVLTVNGRVQTPQLIVSSGGLVLGGNLEVSSDASVHSGAELALYGRQSAVHGTLDLEGLLKLGNGARLTIQKLTGTGEAVLDGSILELNSDTMLNAHIKGKGALAMQTGLLELVSGDALGAGIDLSLGKEAAFLQNRDAVIAGLNGEGTVRVSSGSLTVAGDNDSRFDGLFAQETGGMGSLDHTGAGTLTLASEGGSFVSLKQDGTGRTVLDHSGAISYGDVDVTRGTLEIRNNLHVQSLSVGEGATLVSSPLSDGSGRAGGIVVAGDLTLNDGGKAIVAVDANQARNGTGAIQVGGAVHQPVSESFSFALQGAGNVLSWLDPAYTVRILDTGSSLDGSLHDVSIADGVLKNLGFAIVGSPDVANGLSVQIASDGGNYLQRNASGANASVAADALWSSMRQVRMGGVLDSIVNSLVGGQLSPGDISDSLSSYAGSSATALLGSTRDDLNQQVRWIRNRTVQMGLEQDSVRSSSSEWQYNLWLQGNGGWNKVSQTGDKAGYTLDTWGSTLGMDIDLTDNLVVGVAFTYNNSKLKTRSFDYATGDNDACYGNLFARLQVKNWAHTLILTGGWNDMNLKRNIHVAGLAPLHTSGDTNGSSYGAFYETTYDITLNERNSVMVQPLASASIYRTKVDSYTESGAGDASMNIDGMSATYGTIGLGARIMGLIGENVFGRSSLGEFRLQGVQDYGQKTDSATLTPVGLPGAGMKVHGTRVGTTGVQAGCGLAVPIGKQTTLYGNLDVDFRTRATMFGGNLGLRYSF